MPPRYLLFGLTMTPAWIARIPSIAPLRLAASAWAVGLALSAGAWGCATGYIPNTDVVDTDSNRKVILFCEQYRHAVEEKNVAQLLKLASPNYHQRAAVDEDVDYSTLKDFLTTTFQTTDAIRYEIRYRRVTFSENNHVFVDYTFAGSYRIPGVRKEEWRHSVSDNRLDLVPEGEGYKIIAGM
jgi:hypothetical protein